MSKLELQPYFRNHTLEEFESRREERIRTEEVTEDSIYSAMSRLVKPKGKNPDAVSMPVRIEDIGYERTRSAIARISMKIILLDQDFRPAVTRTGTITDGIWNLDNPIGITDAGPMKTGFLLPSLPDDMFGDQFASQFNNLREDMYV